MILVFLRPKLPKVSQRTEPTRGVRVINPTGSLGRDSYVTATSCMVISICGVQATPSTLLPNCGVSCNYIHSYICISSDNNNYYNKLRTQFIIVQLRTWGFPFLEGLAIVA